MISAVSVLATSPHAAEINGGVRIRYRIKSKLG